MESTDESRRLSYVMDYLIGGVDQSKSGNGGPGCYEFRSDYRKDIKTVAHEGRISENAHNSKQLVLVLYCVMMGIQVGFKFATRTLIFYFQPCHVISTVQIFLLATRPNKYTSIIFRTHLGLLQGPLLALLFPVLDTYTLPFEIEMYFIQHIAILVVPVYLYSHGEPYSCNSLIKFWLCSYPVFVLYHIVFLQPISMYTGVNVSTILCPVPTDPFYGPNYVLHAAWHQGFAFIDVIILVIFRVHSCGLLVIHRNFMGKYGMFYYMLDRVECRIIILLNIQGLCIFLILWTYACLLPVMNTFKTERHHGLCIFLMLCTYACLLPVMDAFNEKSCNNKKEDVVVSDSNGNKKLL